MRSGSSLLRSVAVLQFEAIEVLELQPATRPTTRPPLPLYIEPAPEEALFSWLLRLVTRLGVLLHVLASQSFGIDDRSGHTRWWCRPHPWMFARLSERTGRSVARLQQMTFEGFEPAYRDDEATARFAGRRYDSRVAEYPAYSSARRPTTDKGLPSHFHNIPHRGACGQT